MRTHQRRLVTRGVEGERQADHLAGSALGRDVGRPRGHEIAPPPGSPPAVPGLGETLDSALRADLEPRFGHDFSSVRIHADAEAAASANTVNAYAYTVGSHIVFNQGQFAPHSASGRSLLAHELAHVVQQSTSASRQIQCEGMGDVRLAEAIHELIDKIEKTPAYKALKPDQVKVAEETIALIRKKSRSDQLHWLSMLKTLFDTGRKSKEETAKENKAATDAATAAEKHRVANVKAKEKKHPPAVKSEDVEEKASSDPARKYVKVKGKFGGGTYEVDRTSATNIVVRVKIFLRKTGKGTQADVDAIKAMEDGIEKSASARGYSVDLTFVGAAGGDAFTVDVDPGEWAVATNWAGGDATTYAHELHHLMTFELDRYDYTSHATNESMAVPDRLHWFREELKKPPNYNDPTSLMSSASNPNHDDACRVAGLDVTTCVPARQKALK